MQSIEIEKIKWIPGWGEGRIKNWCPRTSRGRCTGSSSPPARSAGRRRGLRISCPSPSRVGDRRALLGYDNRMIAAARAFDIPPARPT